MGMYVYRLTKNRVALSDGTEANVAIYAYKPCGDERLNARWAFRSGCYASERIKEITPRVVVAIELTGPIPHGLPVYDNPHGWRTFLDDCNLGVEGKLPLAKGVFTITKEGA